MGTPLSVEVFVAGLTTRGLALRVAGERLILSGPAEARTDRIRAYVRSRKPELIDYLATLVPQVELPFACANNYADTVDHAAAVEPEDRDEWASICALGASLDADLRAAGVAREQEPEGQSEDDGDAAFGERLRAAYLAARGGFMPASVCVDLGGSPTTDPGAYLLATVRRLRKIRASIPARLSQEAYLRVTARDRARLIAVANWWDWWVSEHVAAE